MVRLSQAARAAGHDLIHVAETGSTNADALALAASGAGRPTWIVADRQVAGRGRRGRAWIGAPGNLFATLMLADPGPAAATPELCFVAALALDDALLALAPELEARFRLKWPNDGLIDGAKVAGILVEATSRGSRTHVAIGIGVNVAAHPEVSAYPTTALAQKGLAIGRDDLFEALTASMVRALAVWNEGRGFTEVRAGWLARAAGLGRPLTVDSGGERLEGVFAGLDAGGRLILDTAQGRRFVAAGEIVAAAPVVH